MPGKNTITGISLTSTYIALASAELDEGVVVNMSIQPLDTGIEDLNTRYAEGLQELFSTLKVKGADVAIALPAEFALVKNIPVDTNESNVEEVILWELGQQIVGTLDDYLVDFEKVPEHDSGSTTNYLTAAFRKEGVDQLVSLLKGARQNPVTVELDVFSLVNVFSMNYTEKQSDPVIVITVDDGRGVAVSTLNGQFIDMAISTAEEGVGYDSFLVEIERLAARSGFDSYSVFGCGSDMLDEQVVSTFTSRFSQFELLDPFRSVKNLTGFSPEEMVAYSPKLVLAVGLCMRDAEI